MLGLGMSDANYHPIMCCHLWLISHVSQPGSPHTSQALSSPAWELGGTAASIQRGENWGLPQTLGSSHFQQHSGMCFQSRSSDADLGWLWAPPMNLSCMAIKIKANKERFGLRTCQTWNCPRVHSVHHWPVNSLAPSDGWDLGHYNPFSGPWSNLISLHPFRSSGRRVTDQAERYWDKMFDKVWIQFSNGCSHHRGWGTQWMCHLTVSLSW